MSIHADLISKSITGNKSIKVSQTDFEAHLRNLSNDLITSKELLRGIIKAMDTRDSKRLVNFIELTKTFLQK
jgi:hypothetical protein